MVQKSWKQPKLIYESHRIRIFQGPNRRDYGKEVNEVDQVFYIETYGKCRYTKEDAIKALEFIYLNIVYEGERQILRNMLRETFDL